MCWLQFFKSEFQIRNGADVFIRQLFLGFNHNAELVYAISLFFIFLIIIYYNREVIDKSRLQISLLSGMLLESFIWGSLFVVIMGLSEKFLLSIMQRNILPEQFYLSIGAGIWEELLFRVGALGLISYILKHILGYKFLFSAFIAIIISSFLNKVSFLFCTKSPTQILKKRVSPSLS